MDNAGWTPVHAAVSSCDKDIIGILLAAETGVLSSTTPPIREIIYGTNVSPAEIASRLVIQFPKDHVYRYILGDELWYEKRFQAAVASYEGGIQLDPLNASATGPDEITIGRTYCIVCGVLMVGIRYRCTTCNFSICSQCQIEPLQKNQRYLSQLRSEHFDKGHETLPIPSIEWTPTCMATPDGLE